MTEHDQHVFPSSGRWAVLRSGAKRVSRMFATRGEAIRHARVIARKQHAALYIHKEDGTVMSKDNYAQFPVASADKK
jgi:hypothetical protein